MKSTPAGVPGRIPFEVMYEGMARSPVAERHVLEGIARLERLEANVVAAQVTVAKHPVRHSKEGIYDVRIHLSVPGPDVSVSRSPPGHVENEDLVTAIGEAFAKARRALIDRDAVLRGDVKAHEPVALGQVTDVFPDHGFIRGDDGRIVYFHRNSVLGDAWNEVDTGTQVRFLDEPGEQGPHATSVTVLNRRSTVG